MKLENGKYICENCGRIFDEDEMYFHNLCHYCAMECEEEMYEYSCKEGLFDDCLGDGNEY